LKNGYCTQKPSQFQFALAGNLNMGSIGGHPLKLGRTLWQNSSDSVIAESDFEGSGFRFGPTSTRIVERIFSIFHSNPLKTLI